MKINIENAYANEMQDQNEINQKYFQTKTINIKI